MEGLFWIFEKGEINIEIEFKQEEGSDVVSMIAKPIDKSERDVIPSVAEVKRYGKMMRAKGYEATTVRRHLVTIYKFLDFLGGEKDVFSFNDVNKDTVASVISGWRDKPCQGKREPYCKTTMATQIQHVRGFFKWLRPKEPEVANWLYQKIDWWSDTKTSKNTAVTMPEVNAVIMSMESPLYRDTAILIWSAGARMGEIINHKFDLNKIEIIDGIYTYETKRKTGNGRLFFFDDNYEPHDFSVKKAIERIISKGGTPFKGENIYACQEKFRRQLNNVANFLGIRKKVSPHFLLRHSRCAYFVRHNWNDERLKMLFGWTKKSNMTSKYAHFTENDFTKDLAQHTSSQKTEDITPKATQPNIA